MKKCRCGCGKSVPPRAQKVGDPYASTKCARRANDCHREVGVGRGMGGHSGYQSLDLPYVPRTRLARRRLLVSEIIRERNGWWPERVGDKVIYEAQLSAMAELMQETG